MLLRYCGGKLDQTESEQLHGLLPRHYLGEPTRSEKKESCRNGGKILAQSRYLNAPEVVIDQILTGRYADDLGAIKEDILLVEQNARAALKIADYGYVLEWDI